MVAVSLPVRRPCLTTIWPERSASVLVVRPNGRGSVVIGNGQYSASAGIRPVARLRVRLPAASTVLMTRVRRGGALWIGRVAE
jgi:hypothetical protein